MKLALFYKTKNMTNDITAMSIKHIYPIVLR